MRVAFLLCILSSTAFCDLVYVPNQSGLSVIDTNTYTVIATMAAGDSPSGVVVSPDGALAYVSNRLGNNVTVINTRTGATVNTIPVGQGPRDLIMTPNGASVYVSSFSSVGIFVINTATNTSAVVSGMPVSTTLGTAVTSTGSTVYVCDNNSRLDIVDTATNMVTGYLLTGGGTGMSNNIVINSTNTKLYISNEGGRLFIYDTGMMMLTTLITAFGFSGSAITPDDATVYLTDANNAVVKIFDTVSNTFSGTSISVGTSPQGIAITSDGAQLYVANAGSDNVSVIDTSTNGILATIPVGDFPAGRMAIAAAPTPAAPTNLSGNKKNNNSGIAYEIFCDLAWTFGGIDIVDGYRIYRNGTLVGSVDSATLTFRDHNVEKGSVVYQVVAFNSTGASTAAQITL